MNGGKNFKTDKVTARKPESAVRVLGSGRSEKNSLGTLLKQMIINNYNIPTFYLSRRWELFLIKKKKVKETKTRIVGFPRMRLYYEYYLLLKTEN